jgi:NAD(P)H-hydrate epimerase
MIPLLTSKQIHEADAYTITHEPIADIDLMERAAYAFVNCFISRYQDMVAAISIYCGTGNNGGDGLAIARILNQMGYSHVNVKIARFSNKESDNFKINFQRLKALGIPVLELNADFENPKEEGVLIIDALLGSGLNKPLEGAYKKLVNYINELKKATIAVDVPTGFFCEGEIPRNAEAIKADLVITFQQPKINFLLPESAPFISDWVAVDIGIDQAFLKNLHADYQFIEEADVVHMLKPRFRFSNKGTYGHALIIAGQPETMGAALLSATACCQAGAGLTTACIPPAGLTALNTRMPEVMAILRTEAQTPAINWDAYNAVGIGPGLGKGIDSLALLKDALTNFKKPMVIDADALNLLAENEKLWAQIPANSIITPHMKEFDRLFGLHTNWWKRIQTGIIMAMAHNMIILLKNDYTIIINPNGKVFFNSTGNPAMAIGGMGDVLTGIITSFLAQGYPSEEAAILGTFIHGKAGDDLAAGGSYVTLPSKVSEHFPQIMKLLLNKKRP